MGAVIRTRLFMGFDVFKWLAYFDWLWVMLLEKSWYILVVLNLFWRMDWSWGSLAKELGKNIILPNPINEECYRWSLRNPAPPGINKSKTCVRYHPFWLELGERQSWGGPVLLSHVCVCAYQSCFLMCWPLPAKRVTEVRGLICVCYFVEDGYDRQRLYVWIRDTAETCAIARCEIYFTMEDDLHQIWTSLELRLFHVYPMIDVIYRCSCQQKFANASTGCGLFYQSCTSLCAT